MTKPTYPCPCGGKLIWKKEKVVIEGVNCGVLDIEICVKCGEEYFPEESMKLVESKLKKEGLWNIQRRKELQIVEE